MEEIEIFFHGTVSIRAVAARLGQRAAIFADLLGAYIVDICLALFDDMDGPIVELRDLVGGEENTIFKVGA